MWRGVRHATIMIIVIMLITLMGIITVTMIILIMIWSCWDLSRWYQKLDYALRIIWFEAFQTFIARRTHATFFIMVNDVWINPCVFRHQAFAFRKSALDVGQDVFLRFGLCVSKIAACRACVPSFEQNKEALRFERFEIWIKRFEAFRVSVPSFEEQL